MAVAAHCDLITRAVNFTFRAAMKTAAPKLARSAALTNFAEVAASVGLDARRLLSEFGLPWRCLDHPELKVPIDAVRALLEASAARSGNQSFGLLMAEKRSVSNLGALGLLMREQPTLRLALEAATRYTNRLNQALFLTVEEIGDVVVLREDVIVGGSGPVRQMTELAIGVAFRSMKAVLGDGWKARRVCFAHEAPTDLSVHYRVFGRIVDFENDFNGIVCSYKDLDAPNPNADSAGVRYAQELAESNFGSSADDMTARVHQAVLTLLAAGRCSIELVVQTLGIPRRTLYRRLAAEGQTFSDIMDDVRRELVERYIADRHRSLAEVATLLGFSSPSAFSRWYRRRFGKMASEGRRAG
jgi:AraC-like DNA-binding protein